MDYETITFTGDGTTAFSFEVGPYSYGIDTLQIFFPEAPAKLRIGAFCSLAPHIQFYMGGNHLVKNFTTYPFGHVNESIFDKEKSPGHPATNGDIEIGHDVWIGANATILSGVKIGDGAVVGAKSLVAKDIEPYTIVAGNPAKVIRKRFSDEIIDTLLQLKWWEWSASEINDASPILCSADEAKLKALLAYKSDVDPL